MRGESHSTDSDGKLEPTIRTGADLWVHLVVEAGLLPGSWDSDVAAEVASLLNLRLATGEDFEDVLRTAGTSADALLDAFFTVIRPYSSMLQDILGLYERWRITDGDEHAQIEFDFDGVHTSTFNYEAFRKTVRQLVEVCRPAAEWTGDPNAFWGVLQALTAIAAKRDTPREEVAAQGRGDWPQGRRWVESFERDKYAEPIELPSEIAGSDLELLHWVWSLWRQHLALVTGADEKPTQFRAHPHPATTDEALEQAQMLERDHWAANTVRQITPVLDGILTGDLVAQDLEPELVDARHRFRLIERPVPSRVDELEDVLRLPLWKQRSGLFSAWVFAAMSWVIGDALAVMADGNGRLSFSFKAHVVGRIRSVPVVEVWAELRTRLVGTSTGSRKEGVQPDYTLLLDGDGDTASRSVAEVECKQYQRQSRRNFVGALHDYAASRPAAQVILVSHGPADQRLVDDPGLAEYRERCAVIGDLKPRAEERLVEFRRTLLAALGKRSRLLPPSGHRVDVRPYLLGATLRARALSGLSEAELCMHLRYAGPSFADDYTVRSHGSDERIICRSVALGGLSGEEVEINGWSPGTYSLSLHRLVPAAPWPGDAIVEIDWAEHVLQVLPPPPQSAVWHANEWPVADIVIGSGPSVISELRVLSPSGR